MIVRQAGRVRAFGTELEDLEPEPDEKDDPAEDGEVRGHRGEQ
jgi:hypothetical protein